VTNLERFTPDYVTSTVEQWLASSFVPASYRDKATGRVKEADVALSCSYLAALGLDPRTFFPQTFVVGARPGLLAEPQRVLARMGGYDLEPVDYDEQHATVRGRRLPHGTWKAVTITYAQAVNAGWTERNPSYRTMPDRMLLARACTFWISQHAPEVKYGLNVADSAVLGDPAPDEQLGLPNV